MRKYQTMRDMRLTGGRIIPRGTPFTVVWGEDPYKVNTVNVTGFGTLRTKGRSVGVMISGAVPDAEMLEGWLDSGMAESPTGFPIRAKDRDENGEPSWIALLGLQ